MASSNQITANGISNWLDDTETKYQWNGLLTNFSNLDPKEYAQTIFNVRGIVVSSYTGTTLISNPISVGVIEGFNKYEVKAMSTMPLASEVTLDLNLGGQPFTVTMAAGTMAKQVETTVPVSSEMPHITKAASMPTKDASYVYGTKIVDNEDDKYQAYAATVKHSRAESLTAEDIITMPVRMITTAETDIDYVIPARNIQYPTEEQLKEFKYALIFCIPLGIFKENKYKIVDNVFGATADFQKINEVTIDEKQFAVLCDFSEGTQFVGRYQKDITYTFKASYRK